MKMMIYHSNGGVFMAKNQREMVLDYIKQFGSITSYDAYVDLGIVCLPKRISELKKDGHTFNVKVEKSKNRYGKPVSYNRYSLKVVS